MTHIKATVLLFCVMVCTLHAQQVRKFSNIFLEAGVGARGLAMSNAQVASVSDLYASYYNPAGLSHIKNRFQLGAMHAEYFGGIAKYDYVGVGVPLRDSLSTLGFTFLRFAIDDIPNTLELFNPDGSINFDNLSAFTAGDYGILISYARKLPIKGLSLGGNVKVIYRRVGRFANAWGFGIDFGLQYRYKGLRVGFMARDITSTFNAWTFNFTERDKEILVSTNNILPKNSLEITLPKFAIGLSYIYQYKNKFSIEPEFSFDISTDGRRNVILPGKPISLDMNFGLEIGVFQVVYLRTGFGNIQRSTDDIGNKKISFQPNIGAGFKIKVFSVDYTYTDIGNQSEALFSHVVSLRLDINKRKKKNVSKAKQNAQKK